MTKQIDKALVAEIANLTIKAMDISHGVYESLEPLAEGYADGSIGESEARDQLAELRGDLAEADTE